ERPPIGAALRVNVQRGRRPMHWVGRREPAGNRVGHAGYRSITVERPLRDQNGDVVLGTKGKQKGKPQADATLRDTLNVPLSEDVDSYFSREVLPHAPDAWIDEEKTKTAYEIPFNRHFYVFEPPRPLSQID